MADDSKCLKCGAPLTPDARDGVCPKCLLGQALAGAVDRSTSTAGPDAATGAADEDLSAAQAGVRAPETGTASAAPCRRCQTPTPAADLVNGFCPLCFVLEMHDLREARRPAAVAEPQPRVFGDYQLLGEIAQGGMGVVFKARQVSLNRIVAVKMIRADRLAREADIKRFQTEAQAAAQLQHPNIVAIHEVGEVEGQHFFSMDYVPGEDLGRRARAKPLSPRQAAGYVRTIAGAIHYAHERGILHRDLKPSNVLIDLNDEPHVTDFGLAKLMTSDSGVTLSGAVMGTPSYMSPEQASGRTRDVGVRSDVYALGAVLYDLLCGRPPFRAETSVETLRQVVEMEPVLPRTLNPRVPRDLETVVLKCLEKEPRKRYGSAQELVEELGRFLGGKPITARPVTTWERAVKWTKRRPLVAGLAASVVLVAIMGFAGVMLQLQREERQRLRAEEKELLARRNLYISDMHLAQQAIQAHNIGRARTLLNRHRPKTGEGDLRGWEWRYLWKQCQSGEAATLSGHSNTVMAVAFSRDGSWLATISHDKTCRLWNMVTGAVVAAVPCPISWQNALVFSADGSRLFIGAYGQSSVGVYEVPSMQPAGSLPASNVCGLGLSADGQILATEGDKGIRLWDPVSLRERTYRPSARGSGGGVVAFSPQGGWLAYSDARRKILVWDSATRSQIVELQGHSNTPGSTGYITSLAFLPDGKTLVSAGTDRTIRVWDIATGRELKRLAILTSSYSGLIRSIAVSPDGQLMATASADQVPRVWDTTTWQVIAELRGHENELNAVAFSPDGKILATASEDETVKLWTMPPLQGERTVYRTPQGASLQHLAADGQSVFITHPNRRFTLLDTATMQETHPQPLPPGESGTHRYATLPGGQLLVLAPTESQDVTPEWARLIASADDVRAIAHVALSQDGKWLASASAAGTAQLWRADTSQPIRSWYCPHARRESVTALGFSPDGAILAMGYAEGTVEVFKTQTAQSRSRWVAHKAHVTDFAFLVKNGEMLTGSTDGTLKFWDSRNYSELASIQGSMNGIYRIAVSPEEDRLVTGSAEGTIKLWHTDLRQEIALFTGHQNQITELAFHPDGNTVVSMSKESVLVWRAPSLAEIEKADATERITGWKKESSDGGAPFGATSAPLSVSEYLRIRLEDSTNAALVVQAAYRLIHNSKGAPDQLEKADALIAKAARWAPDDPEVLQIRAEMLERRGDWAGAMSLLNDAIGRHRQNPGLWRVKAAMLEETNRLEEAYQAFTKAVQIMQADTNRFAFLLAPVLLERSDLLRRLSRPAEAAADNLLARHIPPRERQAPPSLIDLSAYYNTTFTGLPGGPANHLTDLGTGIRQFDGTEFDVRAVVHLRHPLQLDLPLSVEGIRVNLRCQRLHFLHSVAHALKPEFGLLVGRYVIRFADGKTDFIELKLGVDLWDWHFDPKHPKATQNSKVAWSGTNDASRRWNYMIQVFKSTWANPRPDVTVESIDYVSANHGPGPFLIAITAEP